VLEPFCSAYGMTFSGPSSQIPRAMVTCVLVDVSLNAAHNASNAASVALLLSASAGAAPDNAPKSRFDQRRSAFRACELRDTFLQLERRFGHVTFPLYYPAQASAGIQPTMSAKPPGEGGIAYPDMAVSRAAIRRPVTRPYNTL
jgi:hypothetical protein